ncbi:MAG: twin-arginine translocase TatA/TatE family subunit [Magnetococcales bacterium]|nr:twin-arginine translocase TatA/TatE family subunit [Magnetococcales bacterium]NGZ27714.1 twin-arginine translocase TatA/TatE family subunit [Magnetococcales bacterium]
MGLGIPELLIILVIVLVLFGAGKLPKVMADLGKGVKSFKQGLEGREESENPSLPPTLNAEVKKEPDTAPRS